MESIGLPDQHQQDVVKPRAEIVRFPRPDTWAGERRLQLLGCSRLTDAIGLGLDMIEEMSQFLEEAGVEIEQV